MCVCVFKRVFGAVIYDFIRRSGKRAPYTQVPPSTALALGLVAVTYRNEGGLRNEPKKKIEKKKKKKKKEKSLLLLPP